MTLQGNTLLITEKEETMNDPKDLNEVIGTLGFFREQSLESTRRLDEATGNMGTKDLNAEALETGIKVLAALVADGYKTLDDALDLVSDYRSLAKQYQAMRRKYEVPAKPVHKDSVWHCPSCNRRVHPNHSYCHNCGKKLKLA